MGKIKGFFGILKRSVLEFLNDRCTTWAAAITYYALLSIFPLILGVVAIIGFLVDDPNTINSISQQLMQTFPNASAAGVDINSQVNNFIDSLNKAAPFLSVFSVITVLWSGSGIFDQIMSAVNQAWDVAEDRRNFVLKILLRFVMMLFLGLLLLLSYGFSFAFGFVKSQDIRVFGFSSQNLNFIFDFFVYLLPLTLTFAIFSIIYWLSPDRNSGPVPKKMLWRPVFLGAFIGAVLFEVAKFGLTLYITEFGGANGYQRTYGILAGLIIFLFYMWVSACILLLGAEIAAEASRVAASKRAAWEKGEKEAGSALALEQKLQPQTLTAGAPALAVDTTTYSPRGIPPAYSRNRQDNPVSMLVGVVTIGVLWLLELWRGNRRQAQ